MHLEAQPRPDIAATAYRFELQPDTTAMASIADTSGYPDPKSVLYKSLIVPGWGQIVNKQIWKVPLVYGLLGGLGWYSVYLTKRYHDYRAAYYNATNDQNDLRFGSTPGYIPDSASPEALRSARNQYRNRRDFMYIAIFLAHGLNVLDAYVFAHMRTFDVSEDLSVRAKVKPALLTYESAPGITLSFELFNRSKTR
ncbi:MAG: DUF5683 domain-containing protein [Balneolaceae bacterium]|nr:DUF5683 domain-containing protein [Balneolaceae bacterium]